MGRNAANYEKEPGLQAAHWVFAKKSALGYHFFFGKKKLLPKKLA
jgi:hypothetical protein